MLYWTLKRVLLGPLLRVLFRPWVEGGEHVPRQGGAILASNHLSFSDSFFLPLVVPRRMTFVAKADYFTGTGLKGWMTKEFMRAVGTIPVDRTTLSDTAERSVTVGVRPEDLELVGDEQGIAVEIDVVEHRAAFDMVVGDARQIDHVLAVAAAGDDGDLVGQQRVGEHGNLLMCGGFSVRRRSGRWCCPRRAAADRH